MKIPLRRAVLVLGGAGAFGCGGAEERAFFSTPYDPGSATVVGDQKGGQEVPAVTGCNDATCQAALEQCGANGAADVILDASGNVVEVVCYGQDVSVAAVPTDSIADVTAGNKTVLVLDGQNDGTDVTGDVTIAGNNAIIYGAGPDTSVIGGTLSIEKNNAKIRGVRIQGDLTIDKNDTKLLFCVVEGNLTITGNNTTMAECDVFGTVTLTGLNTTLVADRFAGIDTVTGQNLTCNGNQRVDDANGDFIVDLAEVGGAVSCTTPKIPAPP